MRVTVDSERCTGHGRCYELAPEVYDENDEGYCRVREEIVSADLERAARLGEVNCPERAITTSE